MANLVNYSSSDTEDEVAAQVSTCREGRRPLHQDGNRRATKRKADTPADEDTAQTRLPPPLPTSLHALYATNVRSSSTDDPTLHGGRRRQVPHIEGNWPTHCYLDWLPNKSHVEQLEQIVARIQMLCRGGPGSGESVELHSFLRSALGVQLSLHISLSAPLVTTTSSKDDFCESIRQKLKIAQIHKFSVGVESLDLVPNFDESRHFLILRLTRPESNELNNLLAICNAVCAQHGLPLLYNHDTAIGVRHAGHLADNAGDSTLSHGMDHSDAFHISIAWSLGKPADTVRKAIQNYDLANVVDQRIIFGQMKIKVGNVIHEFPLNDA